MTQAQPRQVGKPTYERSKEYDTSRSVFRDSRTIYLFQRVDDVSIGTGKNYETGELYNMTIPIPVDSFYSNEYGGKDSQANERDWQSLKKEVILRGWDYNGKIYQRTSKEGREFAEEINRNFATIEAAINFYFDPQRPDKQIVKVTPTWAYITLVMTVILLVLVFLSINRIP